MLQRGLARRIPRHGGEIDVAHALSFMPEVAFFLEDAQHRTHRGVGGRIGEPLEHLRGTRPPETVDRVHDLPLAATQVAVRRRLGRRVLVHDTIREDGDDMLND